MPIYDVTIDGTSYTVNSEYDLTDEQAYQYALQQSEQEKQQAQQEMDALQPPSGTGTPTGVAMAARGVPGIIKVGARGVAANPAYAQKIINAGTTATAAAIGGNIGGIPGALAGGAVKGMAPSQAGLRESAGRILGEAPDAARTAGRATGTVNYAKEMAGMRLAPTDLISTGDAARAVDAQAEANGLKVVRLYGADGKVAIGPEAPVATQPAARPGIMGRTAEKVARVAPALARVSGVTAVGDLAQAVEPNRRDIGVLGIGASPESVPSGAELDALNKQNIDAMNTRVSEQDAARAALIDRILRTIGLR